MDLELYTTRPMGGCNSTYLCPAIGQVELKNVIANKPLNNIDSLETGIQIFATQAA